MTVVFVPSGGASVVATTIIAAEVALFSSVVVVAATTTVVVVATSTITTIVLATVLVATIVLATVIETAIILATALVASIIEGTVISSFIEPAAIVTFGISSIVSGSHILLVGIVVALVVGESILPDIALLLDHVRPTSLSDVVFGWYWDLFNLDTGHIFNSVEEFFILTIEECDANATVASSGSSTGPMDVGLSISWRLQLDN